MGHFGYGASWYCFYVISFSGRVTTYWDSFSVNMTHFLSVHFLHASTESCLVSKHQVSTSSHHDRHAAVWGAQLLWTLSLHHVLVVVITGNGPVQVVLVEMFLLPRNKIISLPFRIKKKRLHNDRPSSHYQRTIRQLSPHCHPLQIVQNDSQRKKLLQLAFVASQW